MSNFAPHLAPDEEEIFSENITSLTKSKIGPQ